MIQKIALFLAFFLAATSFVLALDLPSPQGHVNDFANILTTESRQNIENRLADLEARTSVEIALVTLSSLNGQPLEEYSLELFENWGIGKKGTDNGLLLLIVSDDRSIRLEVGYGLEGTINDGRAGSIIRQHLVPAFQQGDFSSGIESALDQIETYITADPSVVAPENDAAPSPPLPVIFVFIFITYFLSFIGRTKEIVTGGIGGFILGFLLGGFLLGLAIGLLGLLLDFLLSKNYRYNQSRHLPTGFWGSRGGFGTGSGSGGFGGFGGGRSGGGGASGKW